MEVAKTSVSKDEMEKFKELSKYWWDADGPMKPLIDQKPQLIVPYMLKYLAVTNMIKNEERTSKRALQNYKILDVGGGGGILAENLAALKADVTSLDPSEDLIEVAKKHMILSGLNIKYDCETVENFCVDNKEKFDIVTVIEVLDHVTDVRGIVKASVECLKPGGMIFISTINRTYLAWLGVIVICEYVLRVNPIGSHHYKMFVTPKEVKDILEECGCRIIDVSGNYYGMISRSWSHTCCKGLLYSVCAVKEDLRKIE
jgi:ubiquinone biosynthesis O-methyltransferase